ncbi:MAG: minichromosome maintenance protein MCM [Candidatus Bathyarchaeia archaeon]
MERTFNIADRFQDFLRTFRSDDGSFKYREQLVQIASLGLKSLRVSFIDLRIYDEELAVYVQRYPSKALSDLEKAAFDQLKIEARDYAERVGRINVRFKDLMETIPLRKICVDHLGQLVQFEGIIVRATAVYPLLTRAIFACRVCGHTSEPIPQEESMAIVSPSICPNCKKNSWKLLEDRSEFINYQELRVQERPEDLPPGQIPRWIDIVATDDLVDVARPGDSVVVTGIVKAKPQALPGKGKLRIFNLVIEANNIEVKGKEPEQVEITIEEEERIRRMASDPNIYERLKASIAPAIYGYEDVKEAIVYLLFGGVPIIVGGNQIRGDVNILIIGDPGTGKSQLLQYVHRVAPRGLYTHGRGTTAAGLTAAVVRDRGGAMALEAGALVLSDRGVCAIDEIDKMRPEDRVAMHEAMEQQTVSIAKGGIVATLNARTSIIAAANPAFGRYDPLRTVADNINLPVSILSRFDLIFVLRDKPDKSLDTRIAEHVLMLHTTRELPVAPPIEPEFLRKYIAYAKRINPKLSKEAMERIKDFYLRMRALSESSGSPIAITVRQLESIIRLAEARARAALRDTVTVEDAEAAIRLMEVTLEQVGFDIASGKIDIDIIMTGKPKSMRDKLQLILSVVSKLEKEGGAASRDDLVKILEEEYGMDKTESIKLINQMLKEGTLYEHRPGFLKKTM